MGWPAARPAGWMGGVTPSRSRSRVVVRVAPRSCMGFATAALALVLTGPEAVAQEVSRDGRAGGRGAGSRPGTRRFNVTFARRDFDLREYADAIAARAPAAAVAAIVADLELRARAGQEPFRKAVE